MAKPWKYHKAYLYIPKEIFRINQGPTIKVRAFWPYRSHPGEIEIMTNYKRKVQPKALNPVSYTFPNGLPLYSNTSHLRHVLRTSQLRHNAKLEELSEIQASLDSEWKLAVEQRELELQAKLKSKSNPGLESEPQPIPEPIPKPRKLPIPNDVCVYAVPKGVLLPATLLLVHDFEDLYSLQPAKSMDVPKFNLEMRKFLEHNATRYTPEEWTERYPDPTEDDDVNPKFRRNF